MSSARLSPTILHSERGDIDFGITIVPYPSPFCLRGQGSSETSLTTNVVTRLAYRCGVTLNLITSIVLLQ